MIWLVCGVGLLVFLREGNPRYWLTYLPCLLFLLLVSAPSAWRWVATLVLAVNAVALAAHLVNPDRMRFVSPYWTEHNQLTQVISEHVPDSAIVLSGSPHNFFAATGIESALLHLDNDPRGEFPGRRVYVVCPKDALASRAGRYPVACSDVADKFDFTILYEGTHITLGEFAGFVD